MPKGATDVALPVTAPLNRVQPYDWRAYLTRRLNAYTEHAPLEGIEQGGYHLTYVDQPSEAEKDAEQIRQTTSVAYSIGLRVNADGSIIDVLPEMAAGKAGDQRACPRCVDLQFGSCGRTLPWVNFLIAETVFWSSHGIGYPGAECETDFTLSPRDLSPVPVHMGELN